MTGIHTPGLLHAPGALAAASAHRQRKVAGGLYGLTLGVLYAFTAGTLDWLLLRDVPLRLDWPSVLLATAGTGLLGLALGVVTAWPESFVVGVIAGAGAISAGGTLFSLATHEFSFQLTVALLATLISRAALSALIALPLRALAHWHEDNVAGGRATGWTRFGLPATAIVLGVFFGSLAQMSPEAKAAVRQTDRIVQNGLAAQAEADLPPALRRVPDFQARASARYLLDQRLEEFSADRLTTVFVYFDNGFVLRCLYPPHGSPVCEAGPGSTP